MAFSHTSPESPFLSIIVDKRNRIHNGRAPLHLSWNVFILFMFAHDPKLYVLARVHHQHPAASRANRATPADQRAISSERT